jgi:glycosyltransferase involved in cell wall biosynthesis
VKASIVIPVLNGGEELRRCLDRIAAQQFDGEVELVIVDSGSTDGTGDLACSYGAVVHRIERSEFNHGATRNLGAGLATGDVLVFTSHDAYAEDDGWLEALVAPLRDDPGLGGVYGRQLPLPGASPPEEYFLGFLYGAEPRDQSVGDAAQLSMETTLFSNVNSAIPRAVWERFPFADDVILSEDQEWSVRVLLAGYHLRYEPNAVVRHSHEYTLKSAFRRFFDSGASADRAYLSGKGRSNRVLLRNAFDYGRGELRWLVRTGRRRWIPYTAVYELTKFTALQLGAHHRWLPRRVRQRFSAFPGYWS